RKSADFRAMSLSIWCIRSPQILDANGRPLWLSLGLSANPARQRLPTSAIPQTGWDRVCCSARGDPVEDRSLPLGWQSERHRKDSCAYAGRGSFHLIEAAVWYAFFHRAATHM